jgi:hypothetical protein
MDEIVTPGLKDVKPIRYHKLFGPDKKTDIVKMRYYYCHKHTGKFCAICAAENGRLPLWMVIKNKLYTLWGR